MKTVALLAPVDHKLFSVAAILDVLETVNRLYTENRKEAPFNVLILQMPGQTKTKVLYRHPVRSIRSNLKADLILIPSFTTDNLKTTLSRNAAYLPWLKSQFRSGAEIASFCTGAFLFAESGLLNGRLATTHVNACSNFIVQYPSVFVKPGRTLTVDGRCYTSGGSTFTFHLLIFLVQKYCGNEMAVKISKLFSVEPERHQQSYFSTFRPDHSHNDDLVKRVQRKLESNFLTINTIEEATKDLPASRRNIVRRFKQATGIPPIEYLQNIRIETAKKQLEQTDLSIAEIISGTGYADPKSFRKVFLKLVGIAPLEYREKFRVK